jgi:hypothetical protein
VLSFEDQLAPEQADGNSSLDVARTREPVETGAIPAMVPEESWMKDYGDD